MAASSEDGQHRTDAHIFAQARKCLDERPSIPATVHVHIADGHAWLTGTVSRSSVRAEAEDVVGHVPGVRDVVNKIVVAQTVDDKEWEVR